MTKFRQQCQFPVEHMRLIGEICIQWRYIELAILQAVCECNNIDNRVGNYLGRSISFPDLVGMLESVAGVLKEEGEKVAVLKERSKLLFGHLQALRSAYLIRNKYAHAEMTTQGPDADPYIHFAKVTQKLNISDYPLTLEEMKADSDKIHDAGDAFLTFMQACGFCKTAWW